MHAFANRKIRYTLFFVFAVLFLIVGYGAHEGGKKMSNRAVDWLPVGFQETKDFYWYLGHFYEGELLLITWEGCDPESPAQEKIARDLVAPDVAGHPALFRRVMTTREIFHELTGRPLNLTESEAYSRMQGWIVSRDGQHGCLVAIISDAGLNDPHKAIDRVYEVTAKYSGVGQDRIKLAGPTLDSVAIDDSSIKSQQAILPFFLLLSIVLLFLLLRKWFVAFVIFTAAIFNQQMSTAIVYYSGTNLDTITLLNASLVFVLTISGSLHLINYYRDYMTEFGRKGAVIAAIKSAALPCTLACLTTVMGLYSLTVSSIIPIRNFGVFSTIGLIAGTISFFLLIGSVLEEFPVKGWEKENVGTNKKPTGKWAVFSESVCSIMARSIDRLWSWLPGFVRRFRVPIVLVSFLALFVTSSYLPRLESTITFHGMFKENARVIQEYDYLEKTFGGLIPVEVVVSVPKKANANVDWLNQILFLDMLDRTIWESDNVDCTLSILNFIPSEMPTLDGGFRNISRRRIFNRKIEESLAHFRTTCLFDDRQIEADTERGLEDSNRWRVSIRVQANKKIAYGPFLTTLKERLDKAIQANAGDFGVKGASIMLTGGVPLVHKAQGQLLSDLCSSYLSAFLLILAAVVFFFKGLIRGTATMIPNIYPSVIVFGTMAMLHKPVDMGTMMTASVALGISVDGTIHLLTWYKRGIFEGKSQADAVEYAYRRCGTAIVQSTILCGGGMLIFGISDFIPIARFSWMLAILLLIALYGDIVLFPAMLNGWAGRLFIPREMKNRQKINMDREKEKLEDETIGLLKAEKPANKSNESLEKEEHENRPNESLEKEKF